MGRISVVSLRAVVRASVLRLPKPMALCLYIFFTGGSSLILGML